MVWKGVYELWFDHWFESSYRCVLSAKWLKIDIYTRMYKYTYIFMDSLS